MNLLFVHQSFPGQYIHILRALDALGVHRLVGLGIEEPSETLPEGVQYFRYGLSRGNHPELHVWAKDIESKVIRAEACASAANQLKEKGFVPDLICGHPGWGELLFLKDVWPTSPVLSYQEFFYNPRGFDYDFDPELQGNHTWQSFASVRVKTANQLLNLHASDWSVTATEFQRSSYPKVWQNSISVIHDGIDTDRAIPSTTPNSVAIDDYNLLKPGEKVVTFVNRSLEPYRGCHSMIRAIPYLQRMVPESKIVLIGDTRGVSYGSECTNGDWKDVFLADIEGQYDASRVFFVGKVSYSKFISLMQLSRAHVYLTYPFVLSWSLLEAMSCGCAVVGSDTAPVQEIIENYKNGLLVNFFDYERLAASIAELLKDRSLAVRLGKSARETVVQRFRLEKCVQSQLALIDLVANGSISR